MPDLPNQFLYAPGHIKEFRKSRDFEAHTKLLLPLVYIYTALIPPVRTQYTNIRTLEHDCCHRHTHTLLHYHLLLDQMVF